MIQFYLNSVFDGIGIKLNDKNFETNNFNDIINIKNKDIIYELSENIIASEFNIELELSNNDIELLIQYMDGSDNIYDMKNISYNNGEVKQSNKIILCEDLYTLQNTVQNINAIDLKYDKTSGTDVTFNTNNGLSYTGIIDFIVPFNYSGTMSFDISGRVSKDIGIDNL